MANQDFTEKKVPIGNYTEVGRSGTFISSFIVQNDYLSELNGVSGQEIYTEMLLSESQIRKVYHAVSNPIKSAKWSIEPASGEKADIEAAALIEHILFHDLPDGFTSKLDEILTFPWHGHAVFEVIHKNRTHKKFGPYTGLANLAFRDQRSLDKWIFSSAGILERIHQIQSGDVAVDVDLLAENLLIFYNEKKGNDNGYPFCRMMYGNHKRKLLYKQLQAIGIERAAIPVPHLLLPDTIDYTSDEYADAVAQLAAFTQAEQAFFITPAGYDLKYNQTGTFDPSKVQVAIKAENEEIAGSVVAMWLEMGIGGNSAVGSSTSESIGFFRAGIEYIADKIKDKINLELIPNLIALNFGDTLEVLPKLIHNGISDEAGKELMEIVTGYVEKGVITPDPLLEDHLRKAHNLPKKVEGTALENQTVEKPAESASPETVTNETISKNEEVQLSSKDKIKNPKQLIDQQASKVSETIKSNLSFISSKYINDVMASYRKLPNDKKQKATDNTRVGGAVSFKKDLKRVLTETVNMAIDLARTEVPSKKNIELSNHERDVLRMVEKFGDISEIKLSEFSKLPGYLQILLTKQSDLISSDAIADLKNRLDFSFSSIEVKTVSEEIIQQALEEEATAYLNSGAMVVKGVNASSIMVNEGRDAFFFEPDVLEEIHSFTFVNSDPKAPICKELAGTTFNTNDAESLRYTPPLHHNCKSYLRANLKESKGVERLQISSLSPSAEAKKSITL